METARTGATALEVRLRFILFASGCFAGGAQKHMILGTFPVRVSANKYQCTYILFGFFRDFQSKPQARISYAFRAIDTPNSLPASSAMEGYSFISADVAKTRKAHGFKRSCASPRDSITAGVSHPLSPHRSSAESSVLCQRPGGIGSRSSVGA